MTLGASFVLDCPACRSAGSVSNGACQVCFAEPGETTGAADEPDPVRFADVIAELEAVAGLAPEGASAEVAEACRCARKLLLALKEQFVQHVVLAPAGSPPVPELAGAGDPEATALSV